MRRYVIEVARNNLKHYYWRLKSINGKILANSEIYSSKAACVRIATKLQDDMLEGVERCELREV